MRIEAAYELLANAFAAGRPAHGYLVIAPPRGAGQALTERVLALLFCEADSKPCGECRGCVRVAEHRHPDLLWIEPQKKSRIISVDEVRDMQSRVYQTSFEGGWRAVVLAGADRLGAPAANAFLKTLEEPPSRCVFFLLTDRPQGLLPTILSRCQRVTVEGVGEMLPDDVRERLVSILAMDSSRSVVASLGQADLLQGLLKGVRDAVEKGETEQAEAEGVEDAAIIDARTSARFREIRSAVMRFAVVWYRDVVMLLCGQEGVVYNTEHIDILKAHASRVTTRTAMRNVQRVEEMHRRLERNVADRAVYSLGFAGIK